MNAIGVILWEGVLHATAFAALGSVVYLALRRWSPAAGALGAASTLVVMAVVAALAVCPYPRWASIVPERQTRAEVADPAGRTTGPMRNPQDPPSVSQTPAVPDVSAGTLTRGWDVMLSAIVQTLDRQLTAPAAGEAEARGGWRGWLIPGLLASMGLGLTRLATGAWAMRRLRLRSQRLHDDGLVDTVEILRAEMNCLDRVEVRTSGELATPATIGWKRSLILLPEDWRSWTEEERRAVLAHELAHVCRGDFLTGLLAQFSLALQFYHPLAHWLAARLRLEQELAADAWSARLSGGNLPYLTTLAQMALRRDAPTLSWPARAFLPSRGTFVRRIEMLHNSKRVRHVWLSARMRFVTVSALVGLGLLVAGLRRPMAAPIVPAQAAGAAALGGAGQEKPLPAKGAFDLGYLPAETRMFLAVQPSLILDRPEVLPSVRRLNESRDLKKMLSVDPGSVIQLLVFWEGTPGEPAQAAREPFIPPPSGMVIRLKSPEAAKEVLAHIAPGLEEVRHAGLTYYRPSGPKALPGPLNAYLPDDRTIFAAMEDLVRTHIEDRKSPAPVHPWNEAWSQVPKGQIAAVLDGRWLRRRYNQAMAGALPPGQRNLAEVKVDTIAPLLENVRYYAVGIDLDQELNVGAVALTGSADEARSVADTAQALLTLGKNAMPSLRASTRDVKQFRERNELLVEALSTLVDKARLETKGQIVQLHSTSPLGLAEAARLAVSFLLEGREHAARMQSVNNLKQIGLAVHNYAATNNHLPPPVLLGGKNGKVPYSWRVAILPYLEQQALYKEYNFDEPWDGPNNSKLLDRMPALYAYAGAGGTGKNQSAYFVFTGAETMLGKGEKPSFADITDGTSNTLMVVEARREIPWTKPEDIPFDPQAPLPQLGGFTPDGFNATFGDGSVRYIRTSINPVTLKALITRAGGEVIDSSSF